MMENNDGLTRRATLRERILESIKEYELSFWLIFKNAYRI